MLSPEDKDDIERMFKPMAEVAKSQAESISKQADHLGKISERMAKVETRVDGVKETVEAQAQRCDNISTDLYLKVNALPAEVTGVKAEAKEANNRSKTLRNWLWGLTGGAVLFLLKIIYDLITKLYPDN